MKVLLHNLELTWNEIFTTYIPAEKYSFDNVVILDLKEVIKYDSGFVKTILFIHSMDSFLDKVLYKAERKRDPTKILTLGGYSSALNLIVIMTENHRPIDAGSLDDDGRKKFYRGA